MFGRIFGGLGLINSLSSDCTKLVLDHKKDVRIYML